MFKYLRNDAVRRAPPACWPWAIRPWRNLIRQGAPSRFRKRDCCSTSLSAVGNAANHALKDGDVLLAYNGVALNKRDDLKVVAEGDKPIPIEVLRDRLRGEPARAPLASFGVILDTRPHPWRSGAASFHTYFCHGTLRR